MKIASGVKNNKGYKQGFNTYNIQIIYSLIYRLWIFSFSVKSIFRKQIEEITKDSRIQKWVFATPEEDIDDPTGEIRRLKEQVRQIQIVKKNWWSK